MMAVTSRLFDVFLTVLGDLGTAAGKTADRELEMGRLQNMKRAKGLWA